MLIGITMGDASGVGPELAIKAFKNGEIDDNFVLVGDYEIIEYCNSLLGYNVPLKRITNLSEVSEGSFNVLDLKLLTKDQLKMGHISKESGYAARCYVEQTVKLALEGKIDALLTLPMNKEATRLSDPNFSGHTELIANICGQDNYAMMLVGEKLTVTHVNTHVSMEEAIKQVKKQRVYNVIKLTYEALKSYQDDPKIAVAGLNPHAGENGSFGREDIMEIKPAVEKARNEKMNVEGPIAPDTVFLKAYKKQFDVVVCMYHDQGHIPMKLLDFEGGVNVTLGLKVIRTSVDHGTAFDIAYKGIASTRSVVEAFKLAQKMSASRKG